MQMMAVFRGMMGFEEYGHFVLMLVKMLRSDLRKFMAIYVLCPPARPALIFASACHVPSLTRFLVRSTRPWTSFSARAHTMTNAAVAAATADTDTDTEAGADVDIAAVAASATDADTGAGVVVVDRRCFSSASRTPLSSPRTASAQVCRPPSVLAGLSATTAALA